MAWFKDWFNTSYYHVLYGERNETEASAFIQALIGYLSPEGGSVFLDLACGKGRHAVDVASYGYDVYGVDLSRESIARARQRSSGTLHFDVHDMRMAYKPGYFDYVLNLFTSFGYFEDRNDNLKTLEAVYTDLKPGGVFVQDYFNANKVLSGLKPLEYISRGGIHFEIRKEVQNNCILKTIRFADGGENYCFQEKVSLFGLSDFEEMYGRCGLKLRRVFGDYTLGDFDPLGSDRLILISEKP